MPFGIERLDDLVEHQAAGLVVALPLLVLDDAALVIELFLRDRAEQIAHAIAFQPQRAFQRAGGDGFEIVGPVEIGRAVVIGRAHFLQVLEEVVGRIFRPVEHQVFEQVGKAGLALGFVLRPNIVPHRDADDRRLAVFVDDHGQSVVQLELIVGNRDLFDQIFQRCGLLGGVLRLGRNRQHDGGGERYGERGETGLSGTEHDSFPCRD